MDLKITQALRGYNATKAVEPVGDDSVRDTLGRAAQDFTETLAKAETVAQQAMTGDADPHALVEALANSATGRRNRRDGARQGCRSLPGDPEDAGLMGEDALFDILRQGLWVGVTISSPILIAALVAQVWPSALFQALTSVQEMTLTFVPKLGVMVVVFWASMGFMTQSLVEFFRGSVIPMIAGS